MSLAEKSSLHLDTLLDVLSKGAMANGMFALKGPTMVDGKFAPAFPLKHQQKDLRLACELGCAQISCCQMRCCKSMMSSTAVRCCSCSMRLLCRFNTATV